MAEQEFRRREAEVTFALSQPHVRDVWEERLPLALDAALSIGCVAFVAPAVRSRPLSDGFDVTDLQVRGMPSCAHRQGADGAFACGLCLYQTVLLPRQAVPPPRYAYSAVGHHSSLKSCRRVSKLVRLVVAAHGLQPVCACLDTHDTHDR
jgi:hypothetical protein